ncbi:MAG: efflux transporter outer membrane subunit [Candidatus Auribacterota bacterium]
MRLNKMILLFITAAGLSLVISGCAVGPDYVPPEFEMPKSWNGWTDETEQAEESAPIRDLSSWWALLNDPVLDKLIARANEGNITLKEAYYRIAESQAAKRYAQGDFLPHADVQSVYSRTRGSENTTLKGTNPHLHPMDIYSAGVTASWEVDMFGRIRRSVESADAFLDASQASYNDIIVSLNAAVASNYIALRTLQERIDYAQKNIVLQKETLKLTDARFKSELVPELDVEQAKLNLANTEAAISSLEKAKAEVFNRLAILLGGFPQDIRDDLSGSAPIPEVSPRIPKVLPINIIKQRPDIRAAEREYAARNARIGAATAGMYPIATLNGSFFLDGIEPSDLRDMSSRAYSFGPRFDWNAFEGGKNLNTVRIEQARTEQARLRYEQTVLTAVEEVENALAFYTEEKKRYQALERASRSSEKSVELAGSLYKSGLTDFQNVLDMERTLFTTQDELAASKGQIIQEWIGVYKAFGGGWSQDTDYEKDTGR